MTKLRLFRAGRHVFFLSLCLSSLVIAEIRNEEDSLAMPEARLSAVNERLAAIDSLVEDLNKERTENRNVMRTLHMDRFQARQQLQTDDEEIADLQQQIVDAEKQLHDLKLALNQKLAEQPAYQEASAAQQELIQREGAIAREAAQLYEERAALQAERKQLQLELDETAGSPDTPASQTQPEQETP